jgi:alkaline phosphatase D
MPRRILPLIFLLLGLPLAASPYFGNGVHNGYADQTSVVLWTRLTKTPGGKTDGRRFLEPIEQRNELDQRANPAEIWAAQVPPGLTLEDMGGACPGMSGEVRLVYHPRARPEGRIATPWTAVDADRNFTRQWRLSDLSPGTAYVMELEARSAPGAAISDRLKGAFQTAPVAEEARALTFCVVSCHDYPRRDAPDGHRIYPAMTALKPDFYVHTGDIEYYDRPGPYALTEELMRFKWDRLFALPLQRDFWNQVTSYFMKDDHDVLTNDASSDKRYGTVSWERGLQIFEEQTPGTAVPYKTIRWGRDLQIWLTEGRTFRSRNTDPDGPDKSLLGADQKAWLFRTLLASDATFKVVICANPIVGPDRINKRDNLANANWSHEGNELRAFLNRMDNVMVVTGDRHWQYVSQPPGTRLWEFSVGSGSDQHAGGWPPDDVRPEHRFLRVKGGFLSGHVSRQEGKAILRFDHRDVDGTVVHTESFPK